MTNPISRRKILGVAGTAAGSYAVSGILNGKVLAAPSEFCDFVWPMTGNVIQTSDVLEGIHVGNDIGTPIYASRAGEVKSRSRIPTTSEDQDDFLISINHENGYTTSYLPLRGIALEEGDTIERSQLIGYLGDLESNEIVPGLFFDIRRNAESRPIPGHINEHVAAGEMISKDYAGIECPNGDPEPGPGPIFNDLKSQKIALAERIETISGGSIQEVDQVQAVIGNLETEATNGTISFQEAANAVRRLKLGEEVTERTLVGAGPATPDANGGSDSDVATPTAEAVLSTGTNLLLSIIPFDNIIQSIPYGKSIIDRARREGKRAIKWLITTTVGRIKKLTDFVNRHADNVASEIYGKIEEEALGTAEEVRNTLLTNLLEPKERLVEFLLNQIEDGDAFGAQHLNATELNEALDNLNSAADPATGLSFEGTLSGANQATSQGIDAVNENIDETMDDFDLFEATTNVLEGKIVSSIISIATIVGLFTGGVFAAVVQFASNLISFATSLLTLLTARIGWQALANLRDNHAQTLDAIVAGHGDIS